MRDFVLGVFALLAVMAAAAGAAYVTVRLIAEPRITEIEHILDGNGLMPAKTHERGGER